MATHSVVPAWEIPWTEKTAGLHAWGCKRVGQDLIGQQQQQCIMIETVSLLKTDLRAYTQFQFSPQTKCTEIIIVSYSPHSFK